MFWVQFAKKISLLDIPGAKIFLWAWNFKISYFDISMDKMIYFKKIYNLWNLYQSGTLIPYLSKYYNKNQIISLNRENEQFLHKERDFNMNILNLLRNIFWFPTIVNQTKVMSKTENCAVIQINIHFLEPTMKKYHVV